MGLNLLQSNDLRNLLTKTDHELAGKAHATGCPLCGSALHRANYKRQPRWPLWEGVAAWDLRLSFCCSADGCRKRRTPPSVRFLGRRVYVGVVVALVCAVCVGLTHTRVKKLREHLGIDRRTLDRWRKWWLDEFVKTPAWKELRGDLVPAVDEQQLPACLLARFGDGVANLERLMRALARLSTACWVGEGAMRGI